MTPEMRTEYIVACIREAWSMPPDDAKAFLAEHDAELFEGRAGRVYAAGVLVGTAEGLIASCPDHGNRNTCFIACQCPAAEELQRIARTSIAMRQAGEPA